MDLQPLFDGDYRFGPAEPSVPRPDLDEQLCEAEWLQDDGRHFRLSPFGLNRLRRFIGSRFDPARIISGDLFFLITGAMVALDLVLVIWLSQR